MQDAAKHMKHRNMWHIWQDDSIVEALRKARFKLSTIPSSTIVMNNSCASPLEVCPK